MLITSDTTEGKLCARMNARLMHKFLFTAASHAGGLRVPAPRCKCGALDTGDNPCENVTIEVIEGLEGKKFGGKVSAQVLACLDKHSAGRESVAINITGGYKGTIPAVTFWVLNRRAPGGLWGASVPLYYQHLSSKETVRVQLLPDPDNPGQQTIGETVLRALPRPPGS